MILKASDFFDLPRVLDCSVTAIPRSSSAPIQVIAKTTDQAYGISYKDNTGGLIGVYIGPSGHEQLVCMIGGGDNGIGHGIIPVGARVSLGALQDSDIVSGTITAHLLTI